MILTGKQHGYIVQALATGVRLYKDQGDVLNQRKVTVTLQRVMNTKPNDSFFEGFDEEQLSLMALALDDTAKRQTIAGKMKETAAIVREVKDQRETRWIEQRFEEGIA